MSAQAYDKSRVAIEAERLEKVRNAIVQPAEKRLAKALAALRSACRHAGRVVELYLLDTRGPVREEVMRLCLRCGEMESQSAKLCVPSGLSPFRVIRRPKTVLRTECDWTLFHMLLANYRERLHEKALFAEFDAKGVWSGWNA